MSDPVFADLLKACGMKPTDLEGETVGFGGFRFTPGEDPSMEITMSEKVAALVKRAIDDERRRCMEIAETGERTWRSMAEQIGDQDAATLAWGKADACGEIARVIGEGLE